MAAAATVRDKAKQRAKSHLKTRRSRGQESPDAATHRARGNTDRTHRSPQ